MCISVIDDTFNASKLYVMLCYVMLCITETSLFGRLFVCVCLIKRLLLTRQIHVIQL